ncbi:hypothetical protein NDU88_007010 [Pleurodeles waltl]|uniref:Uncharacterized protein n=1 Tax=Pleurodeles waltl TaxID=8319 RepID=A0AAV7QJE1_PLEWA|nr:hypothetical protein NDU88_007010 [Pleurodeles waltl]
MKYVRPDGIINGMFKDFFDPDTLHLFLDGIAEPAMELASPDSVTGPHLTNMPPSVTAHGDRWYSDGTCNWGRNIERLTRSQGDKDMALKAVAAITQDKCRSPLKPSSPDG